MQTHFWKWWKQICSSLMARWKNLTACPMQPGTWYVINPYLHALQQLPMLCMIKENRFEVLKELTNNYHPVWFDDVQYIHQPTYVLSKIKFKTSIKILHILAQGCHLHPNAEICWSLILVMNCILLSAFGGWYIDCKNTDGISNTKLVMM